MGPALDTSNRDISNRMANPEPLQTAPRRDPRVAWVLGAIAVLALLIFAASFFLDSMIRSRVIAQMNSSLVGYHTNLSRAHVQFLNGSLTLFGLVVIQNSHPTPPVADIPKMSFHIQGREIFSGRVVADLLLSHPHVHINLIQLRAEKADPVPFTEKGWQDAIQAIYPFKINLFRIRDGEFTYIDTDPKQPFHLHDLSFRADNIRNIHYREQEYPSPFHLEAVAFDKGRVTIDGKGNFLAKPLPGLLAQYWVENMPLKEFEPELQRANFHVYGGNFTSNGKLEYNQQIRRYEVDDAVATGVHLDYVHTSQTATAETDRMNIVKTVAAKVTNAPDTVLDVHQVKLVNSELKFLDEASNPHFRLMVSQLNLKARNLSNHLRTGPANLNLTGKLMGSGDTTMTGVLRPESDGPDFSFDLTSVNTDLTSLNDFLRAYGKFDVSSGHVSIYTQMSMKKHYMTGYVKPIFTDIKVYDPKKDAKKPILHQAYEVVVAGAAKLFKNRSTNEVATKVDISGPVNTPNISIWQAIGQFIQNAFVKAIVPGYDHEVNPGQSRDLTNARPCPNPSPALVSLRIV